MSRVLPFSKDKLPAGKVYLVTGGTGSFGRYCVKMILKECSPAKVIVFSRDELKQYEMAENGFDDERLRFFIGDIRDKERLVRAFQEVDYVIHAAALKQVTTCEYNPMEAILTNVMGTRNVIEAALDSNVSKVIALSTDKAVNPINLYGATKLCAEKLVIHSNAYAGFKAGRFSCVRYGNVVGSRGSVVPVFLRQKKSGIITITDERMTRFWITLNQGTRFVLDCLQKMKGGEVFVPKIPSMNVVDLAAVVAPGCKLQIIGIRPGEKLHETLISEDDARHVTEWEDRFVISDRTVNNSAQPASYSSDRNPQMLTALELTRLLQESADEILPEQPKAKHA